jgi:class 3 adenylate cyclase/YHS domain-containing protein
MNDDESIEASFCFVDIAGFTALTDTHGEVAAADLVDDFARLVTAAAKATGTLQSLTGDCAFLIFPGPAAAIGARAALYQAIADRHDFPVVRAGVHHGRALLRGDRHFGTAVNLAARVAARAVGGQVLCTRPVADGLRNAPIAGVAVEHRGATALRNLAEPVELFEVVLPDCARDYAIDPVCKMQVDTRRAAGDLQFEDRRYWFCSLACVERFTRRPGA